MARAAAKATATSKRSRQHSRDKPRLTHLDERGSARMVDVGAKDITIRTATAETCLWISTDAREALVANNVPKGDAIATARIAGIAAAKRTHDLIPLCHPLKITSVKVDLDIREAKDIPPALRLSGAHRLHPVHIVATVKAADRTGVEMEALTAAQVAALTLYDMLKAIDKGMISGPCRLREKKGGKSGDYHAKDVQH